MRTDRIPRTDSIEELVRFWDAHDLTDFENELEEAADQEIALTRGNVKLMAFLDQRAKQRETVPLDEVKRQLGLNE